MVKGLPAEWGTCYRTVSLDSDAQDLSYWNNTIAVGSDRNIIILNAITGSQEATLSGHTGSVGSVIHSPDGVFLVSGSYDRTVKLWDVQTGGVVKTFHGHTNIVSSVSISADCTRVASGSADDTIHLWNVQTGECHCIVNLENSVWHISFFPTDPQHLLFACAGRVNQLDTDGHQVGYLYDGSCPAISPDGTQLVLWYQGAVIVQNSGSGVIVAKFQVASSKPNRCCCFSPDGKLIAAGADNTAYVWDIASPDPHLIETFAGHTNVINSLAFSSPSSLISASQDKSIKFWQIGSLSKNPLGADPESISLTSAKIESITLQAKDGIVITSDSDGVVRTWDILTGVCKTSFQAPLVAKSFCSIDAQLINGKPILCQHADGKLNIWDAEKGKLLVIDGLDSLHDLKISEDGSRVFCLAGEFVQAWSIQTGESVGMAEVGPTASGPITVDDSRVWVQDFLYPGGVGWDFGTPGSLPVRLPYTPAYKLHPNGIVLWDTGLHRIKDITGKVFFQLSKRYGEPYDVQWNGQYLVACFSVTEVLVLDFSHILE